MGQGLPLDGGKGGGPLGGVLFHVLEPGGGVVEEVPHHHGGALGASGLLAAGDHAPLQLQGDAEVTAGGAGEDLHPGDRGDGGQGLPPEAQGADGLQVVLGADLAGGVAEEGGLHVGGVDAAAVVGDPDVGHASPLDLHREGMGPGVDGVLHQLLHHRGGALHHLAGGDEVGHMAVQHLDMGHKSPAFSSGKVVTGPAGGWRR